MPKTNEEVREKTIEIVRNLFDWLSDGEKTLSADDTSTMLALVTEMLFSMLETSYGLTQKEAERLREDVMATIIKCLGGRTAPLPGYL